jgi:hypothetical protein
MAEATPPWRLKFACALGADAAGAAEADVAGAEALGAAALPPLLSSHPMAAMATIEASGKTSLTVRVIFVSPG